jgi:hypothetical protein
VHAEVLAILDTIAANLYRRSDRRLSAKLVPTFADRGVSGGKWGNPTAIISVLLQS